MSSWRPPTWYDRMGGVAWRFIALALATGIVLAILLAFGVVVLPIVLAVLFATVLVPVSDRLQRRLRPAAAAAITVVVLLIPMVSAAILAIVAIVEQWPEVSSTIDDATANLEISAEEDLGLDADETAQATAASEQTVAAVGDVAVHGLLRVVPVAVEFVGTFGLSLLVTFFFLKDGRTMWLWVTTSLGDGPGGVVDEVGRQVWRRLVGFVRGTTGVAAVDATAIAAGAWLLDVPYVGLIFVLTFFAAYIPFIGATVAGAFAVLLAVGEHDVTTGLWMLGVVLLVQQIESNFLQPALVGRAVHLHPLVVALAIVAGGAIGGFLGIFLAVPVSAAAVAAVAELRTVGWFGVKRMALTVTDGEEPERAG